MQKKPEQEDDLFRLFAEGVTPLKPINRINVSTTPRQLIPRDTQLAQSTSDMLSEHGASENPITEHLSNGLNRMTLRKLRRGEWTPQDHLDLHGLNTEAARKLLVDFLHHANQQGLRCVNIIHGKGWRSEGREGILKVLTRHWLTQHPLVLAFCEAPQNAGGSGAVWVLLKNSPQPQ